MRFLLYIAIVGVAIYLLVAPIQARSRRAGGSSPRRGSRPTPGPRPTPVAPDDDPAFLAELDRMRREAAEGSGGSDSAADGSDTDSEDDGDESGSGGKTKP